MDRIHSRDYRLGVIENHRSRDFAQSVCWGYCGARDVVVECYPVGLDPKACC